MKPVEATKVVNPLLIIETDGITILTGKHPEDRRFNVAQVWWVSPGGAPQLLSEYVGGPNFVKNAIEFLRGFEMAKTLKV